MAMPNIIAFADEVRAATNGQLEITVHSAGSLFAHGQIKDSVRKGLAPIGEVLMSQLVNENLSSGWTASRSWPPTIRMRKSSGLPRGPRSRQHWKPGA